MNQRTQDYYQAVLSWSLATAAQNAPAACQGFTTPVRRPVLIGLNGPQGAGKSTLTKHLVEMTASKGLNAATLSIDDFYLTRAEQVRLAESHRSNSLMQQRGYPGTHDIALGEDTLKKIKTLKGGETLKCPVYDKSAHQGQGDRLPLSQWKTVTGPLDLVFLEGWMLGFTEAPASAMPDEHFAEVNRMLPPYTRWTKLLDGFIHLETGDLQNIVRWRIEAEERMIASGKPGMTTAEITAYINKFILAYKIYGPRLRANPPCKRTLHFMLGFDRLPIEVERP